MRTMMSSTVSVSVLLLASSSVWAGSLQVTPLGFELVAPASTSVVHLNNTSGEPINAQIRVMKWTSVNGEAKLEPTQDVVASPPIVSIPGGGENVVRVVRLSKQPVGPEESYRIVADEIPVRTQAQRNSVSIAMRYLIPLFFEPKSQTGASLTWSLDRVDGKTFLTAHNAGDRHAKILGITLADSSGRQAVVTKGLSGYALAGSALRIPLPPEAQHINLSGQVSITASSDTGPINAPVQQAQASR